MGGRGRVAAAGLLIGLPLAIGLAAPARANDQWRPIDPADLALKDNPASPGSQAMILYREEYTDSMNAYVTEYYRIKIFTAGGKKYGDIEIPFDKQFSSVKDLKARTILPDGKIVEFTGKPFEKVVVKTGGIKVLEDTFTFPDVQPGCIIEYKYRLQYDSDYYWDVTWNIQENLFTREALFTIRPPMAREDSGDSLPGLYSRSFGLPQPVHPVKQKDGTYALIMHDIPGLKEEPYMMPADMLRGRVQFFFTQGKLQTAAKYWDDQAKKWAHEEDDFIHKKGALEKVVAETIGPNDAPMVKLQKLYARAQQIRNTGLPPIGPPSAHDEKLKDNNNVEDVLKHGYAGGAQINALFIGLARTAGFDASKVLFASRSKIIFRPNLEDSHELTGDVVLVRLNGKNLFLDPASPDFPFGLLTWDECGVGGIVASRKGAEFISIPAMAAAQALTERHANLTLDAKGALTGTLEIDFTGIRGSGIRQSERGEGQTDRRKDLSDIIENWLPSRATFHITSVTGWKHPSAPLRVQGTLSIPGYGTGLGKRLLIPLVTFTSPEASAFRASTRVNAIYFSYPFERRDDVTLHLPAGYAVESLPKLPAVHEPAFVYTVTAQKQGDALHVTRDLAILGFYFDAKYYPAIRDVFSMVKTGDDNQAVLETSVAAASH